MLAEGTSKQYIYVYGQLVGYISNNQLYYVHNDHLGRPQVVTDANQAIVWQAKLEAFDRSALTTSIGDFNIGFPGQYWDEEKQSWYNYFRDYDATTGRYLQSDRLGLFDGPNTYGYAHQNPIMFNDPTGEFVPQLLGFAIGAGVEYFTNDCASFGDIMLAGGVGALGGHLGSLLGKTKGLSFLKGLSNQSKGKLGEFLSRVKRIGQKRLAGKNDRIPGQRAFPDHVYRGPNGNPIYVESKFGTSGLTKPQKAAQRALGNSYQVDRWTYPVLQNLSKNIGGIFGGSLFGGANALSSDECGCKG